MFYAGNLVKGNLIEYRFAPHKKATCFRNIDPNKQVASYKYFIFPVDDLQTESPGNILSAGKFLFLFPVSLQCHCQLHGIVCIDFSTGY